MDNFTQLTKSIKDTHSVLQQQAYSAVNQSLAIRNWLIGLYIVEYEQKGEDKATYGSKMLQALSQSLKDVKGLDERSLRRFRQFYLTYNYLGTVVAEKVEFLIRGSLTPELENSLFLTKIAPILDFNTKRGTLSPKTGNDKNQSSESTSSSPDTIRGTVSPELQRTDNKVPAKTIIAKLAYSHLELLSGIEDPIKRTFYEVECIKGTWSVRELKRQISSLYYERSGLSAKPEKLSELTQANTQVANPNDFIKNIYAFEFLNIANKEAIEESDLETALLDNLHQFILELGNGFCLEARQKRILIGDAYYFVDLVFYHRILKCHILIELKIGAFSHEHIGQLNTYLHYYKAEVSEPTDNPPIGLLLVAEKDHALVQYATAGMDQNLFVQQYMVVLPSVQELEAQLQQQLKNWK